MAVMMNEYFMTIKSRFKYAESPPFVIIKGKALNENKPAF